MLIETLKYLHCKAQSCYSNSVSCIRCSNSSSMKNYKNYTCWMTSKPQMLNYAGTDSTNIIYTKLSISLSRKIFCSSDISVGDSFLCKYLLRTGAYTSQVWTA
jgi:hypothetical protein